MSLCSVAGGYRRFVGIYCTRPHFYTEDEILNLSGNGVLLSGTETNIHLKFYRGIQNLAPLKYVTTNVCCIHEIPA
jgi:hypothetical protein